MIRVVRQPIWTPASEQGLNLWLEGDLGLTLGATLKADGTIPPAATISGTPAAGIYGVRIEVTTGGARGIAIFRWSTDAGSTWTSNVLTAATTALGSTGLTVAWPVGAYTNDNVYRATASAWADQSGSLYSAAQSTATKQPVITPNSLNGLPTLDFDGVDDCLQVASFANGTPFVTVAFVARGVAAANTALIELSANFNATNAWAFLTSTPADGRVFCDVHGAAGYCNPTTPTNTAFHDNNPYLVYATIDTTLSTHEVREIWVNGVSKSLTYALDANNSFAFQTQTLNIGSRNNGASSPWLTNLAALVVYNRVISNAARERLFAYWRAKWGIW